MSTPPDRPPIPAEREALDRPWRRWASAVVVAFVLFSLLLGFVIVPERGERGWDPYAAMCRALGIPTEVPASTKATPTPPGAPGGSTTNVAWTPATLERLANADIGNGKTIAEQLCSACHGIEGVGLVPTYPNLTHQSSAAIFKQLQDYKAGARTGELAAVMMPVAQTLDDQQMVDVAAYYASRPARIREYGADAVSPQIVALVKIGSPARALPPCDSCHGVNMSGPLESPVLLGQLRPYFEQQLQAFASGARHNDIFGRMRSIAQQLTLEEIQQLAVYYAPEAGS